MKLKGIKQSYSLKAPMSAAVTHALKQAGAFAHHAPVNEVRPPRMTRPRGGHGPHNAMER